MLLHTDAAAITASSNRGGTVTSYSLPNCGPGAILASSEITLWVSCGAGYKNLNTVLELNSSGTVLATVTLPARTFGLTFDGTNVWVGTADGVSKINSTSLAVTNYSTYAAGAGMAFDGTNIWACSESNVVEMLASTGAIEETFSVGGNGYLVACTFQVGGGLWESNFGPSGSITKIP